MDFVHFINSVRWHCTNLMKTARLNEDNDRASGEYVTFDQNGQKFNFEFVAADLED